MQKFCCEECQVMAKEARKKRQQVFMNAVEPVIGLQCQEYLTFAKAALLMGCSRQYVYKLEYCHPNGSEEETKLSMK